MSGHDCPCCRARARTKLDELNELRAIAAAECDLLWAQAASARRDVQLIDRRIAWELEQGASGEAGSAPVQPVARGDRPARAA